MISQLLEDMLTRNHMKAVALLRDIKQSYLQIEITEENSDTSYVNWLSDLENNQIINDQIIICTSVYWLHFKRFSDNKNLAKHPQYNVGEKINTKIIKKSKDNMFIDNLTCNNDNGEQLLLIKKKKKKIKILANDGFKLCKWHPNSLNLEKSVIYETIDSITTSS